MGGVAQITSREAIQSSACSKRDASRQTLKNVATSGCQYRVMLLTVVLLHACAMSYVSMPAAFQTVMIHVFELRCPPCEELHT